MITIKYFHLHKYSLVTAVFKERTKFQ